MLGLLVSSLGLGRVTRNHLKRLIKVLFWVDTTSGGVVVPPVTSKICVGIVNCSLFDRTVSELFDSGYTVGLVESQLGQAGMS